MEQITLRSKPQKIFPWYDSEWLSDYVSAIDYFTIHRPEKLNAFVEQMKVFKTPEGFREKPIKAFCGEEYLNLMCSEIRKFSPSILDPYEFNDFGRHIVHNHPFFNKLQREFLEFMESETGEELEVSYNFLSLYKNVGICKPHLDAPFAKWTLDLCIDQSIIWPIQFSNQIKWPEDPKEWTGDWENKLKNEVDFEAYNLTPGDALIFSGSGQWHKREALSNNNPDDFCNLIFFHFIPRGTSELVNPANWAEIFESPGLKEVLMHGWGK